MGRFISRRIRIGMMMARMQRTLRCWMPIGKMLPSRKLVPQPLSNFAVETVTKTGDLAQQLDLYFEYHEVTKELIRRDFVGRPEAFEKLIQIPSRMGRTRVRRGC